MILLLACTPAPSSDSSAPAPEAPPTLLISGYSSDAIHRIDLESGAVISATEGVAGAQSVRPVEGGYLAVAEKDGAVLMLDDDLSIAGTVVSGLDGPTSAIGLSDGAVIVGEYGADRVQRLAPGAETPVVLAEGLDGVDAGLLVGPDGLLWVPCFDGDVIVGLDPETGAEQARLEGSLAPRSLWFDEQGSLWVTAWRSNALLRYTDGVAETVAEVSRPSGLLADPDGTSIWVISDQTSALSRLDRDSGAVLETLDAAALGVDGATFLAWHP